MMLTCESQTPGDRQLFRWKERRSRSNIRSLRPGIAPPGKLRLTNVQSNTNNDNNNNPTEIVTNHWCGRELIWDLNSLAKSVLIDDEHIKALAVSRLPRIDDVSPHLLQRFVARILFKVHHVFTIKKVLTLQARSFCSPKPNLFVTSTSFTEVSKEPEWKILPLIREAPWIEDDWVREMQVRGNVRLWGWGCLKAWVRNNIPGIVRRKVTEICGALTWSHWLKCNKISCRHSVNRLGTTRQIFFLQTLLFEEDLEKDDATLMEEELSPGKRTASFDLWLRVKLIAIMMMRRCFLSQTIIVGVDLLPNICWTSLSDAFKTMMLNLTLLCLSVPGGCSPLTGAENPTRFQELSPQTIEGPRTRALSHPPHHCTLGSQNRKCPFLKSGTFHSRSNVATLLGWIHPPKVGLVFLWIPVGISVSGGLTRTLGLELQVRGERQW